MTTMVQLTNSILQVQLKQYRSFDALTLNGIVPQSRVDKGIELARILRQQFCESLPEGEVERKITLAYSGVGEGAVARVAFQASANDSAAISGLTAASLPDFVSKAESGDPVAFFKRRQPGSDTSWEEVVRVNNWSQATLRKRAPKLMKALENAHVGKREELAALVPTVKAQVTKQATEAGLDPTDQRRRQDIYRARHTTRTVGTLK